MEFFLDVDGVILDFEGSFIDFVRDHYLPDLPLDYRPKSWEMTQEFRSLDIEKIWNRFVKSAYFSQMNLLVDAESFNRLSDQYSVFLITNLTSDQYPGRKKNLDMHNLKYQQLEFAGHHDFGIADYPKKSAMISQLRSGQGKIVFLDDHPANCRDVKENLPESDVYLMSRPHNEDVELEEWIRVNDWQDFIEKAC